jgi:hypothetical protein
VTACPPMPAKGVTTEALPPERHAEAIDRLLNAWEADAGTRRDWLRHTIYGGAPRPAPERRWYRPAGEPGSSHAACCLGCCLAPNFIPTLGECLVRGAEFRAAAATRTGCGNG